MGRGDSRTRKGKQFRKSHGKTRPRKSRKTAARKKTTATVAR